MPYIPHSPSTSGRLHLWKLFLQVGIRLRGLPDSLGRYLSCSALLGLSDATKLLKEHCYRGTVFYIHKWPHLKNMGLVTGPGGLLRQGLFLRQTLLATSLLKTTVLYTEARDKGCSRGPATKVCNRGGRRGIGTSPHFESQPISMRYSCVYVYVYMVAVIHVYIYKHDESVRHLEFGAIQTY